MCASLKPNQRCVAVRQESYCSTIYSVRSTRYSVRSSRYSVRSTRYSVRSSLYSVRSTIYSVRSSIYSVCLNRALPRVMHAWRAAGWITAAGRRPDVRPSCTGANVRSRCGRARARARGRAADRRRRPHPHVWRARARHMEDAGASAEIQRLVTATRCNTVHMLQHSACCNTAHWGATFAHVATHVRH